MVDSGSAPARPAPADGAPSPRVIVCDSRPLLRAGLLSVLADLGPTVESRLDEVVDRAAEHGASVLVAGLRIDDPETFRAIASLKAVQPTIRVLVVADGATVIDLREAVIAGVDSFVLTSAPTAELREAVRRTARGERIISPSIAMQLAGSWRSEPRQTGASALSSRELEVLQLLAEGLTNQEIGTRLDLPSRTVKTHVQNLLLKLDAPDRTGAVARGFRLGLIR